MSAGAFIRSKYEMSTPADKVIPIRVQPETLLLKVGATANAAPSGTVDADWPSAKVSGSRRGIGIYARMVSFVFTGSGPAGYKEGSVMSLPALTPEFGALVGRGVAGKYTVGATEYDIEFISKVKPEVVK